MRTIDTEIIDLKIIEFDNHPDHRGNFIKAYNEDLFKQLNINFEIKEIFYSISNKDVIRGMHFQTPPFAQDKVVHVQNGEVVDVVLDLRKGSPSYMKCLSFNLQSSIPKALYVPKGVAHGFKSLTNNTIMVYMVSEGYVSEYDKGILFSSIDYDWQIENPVISDRDRSFPKLCDFETPF